MFAALWTILSENRWDQWPVIAVALIAATGASLALLPAGAWRWRLMPLLRFVPYFLKESVIGGLDVASRVASRRMPLDPALVEFPLLLKSEAARVGFAWVVSLLPGTASARLDGPLLVVHVLDQRSPVEAKLREVEGHLSRLFGESE